MPAVVPRWLWQNFAQLASVVVSVSSEHISFPRTWVRDQLRSKRWRTKVGWTITAGFNDKIDITEGVTGDAAATLTPGTYATGDLLATEIQTQINAVATDNTWTCAYDESTNKFTISHDNVETGGLEWSTGTNAGVSAGIDLGYDVSADDTGAASYAADSVSYQSRHWIKFDLISVFELKAAIIFDSNLMSSASVVLQGNATDAWTSPSESQTLVWGNSLYAKQFTGVSYRWWRFVIDDVQNPDGFVEIGVVYLGSYTQPSIGYFMEYTEGREELSQLSYADQGAHFQNERNTRRVYQVSWPGLSANDKSNLELIAAHVKVGRSFFFSLDAGTDETNLIYVLLNQGVAFESVQNNRWAARFNLMETI